MDVLGAARPGPVPDQFGATPNFALWRFRQSSFEDNLPCPGPPQARCERVRRRLVPQPLHCPPPSLWCRRRSHHRRNGNPSAPLALRLGLAGPGTAETLIPSLFVIIHYIKMIFKNNNNRVIEIVWFYSSSYKFI